ncbi:hypothetical protein H0H93_007736 [Arthromyces matolae]|nr:hypothetical protein H0H93_007736 [Arthromyces matolae]
MTRLLLEFFHREELGMSQLHTLIFTDMADSRGQIHTSVRAIMDKLHFMTDKVSRPRVLSFVLHTNPTLGSEISDLKSIMAFDVLGVDSFETDNQPFKEVVLFYDQKAHPISSLVEKLRSVYPSILNERLFQRYINDSQYVLDEVGVCACDLYWRRFQKEVIPLSNHLQSEDLIAPMTDAVRRCIQDWIFTLPNLDPTSSSFNVTLKFTSLVKALDSCQRYGEAFRAVIFVRHDVVCIALKTILQLLPESLGFFRPVTLDSGPFDPDSLLQDILRLFGIGVYNVLILTALPENFDSSKVSMIVNYDSGRLDDVNQASANHFVHIFQKTPVYRLDNATSYPPTPKPLLIESVDDINSSSFIRDPTTGSRLGIKDAAQTIDRIASAGQLNGIRIDEPLFTFNTSGGKSICILTIPDLIQLVGPPRPTKHEAKDAACHKVCQHFAAIGVLDCSFFPMPKVSVKPNVIKEDEPAKSAGTRRYSRKEPEFWQNTRNLEITSLYPVVISTNLHDRDKNLYTPLAILTRQPLPDLPSFNIFLSGLPSLVSFKRAAPIHVDEEQIRDLYLYTLRICRTVANKPFECSSTDMAYFFAPIANTWESFYQTNSAPFLNLASISNHIPWDFVKLAAKNFHIPLKLDEINEIQGVVLQDNSAEFTRRYSAVQVRSDLTPLSKPVDSPREADFDNILESIIARRKGFKALQNNHQPLIEVSSIPTVLNVLNPTSRPAPLARLEPKYLIPELCSRFTLPASVLNMAGLLPSIMRRIDEFLVVKELNAILFDSEILPALLHTALSTPSLGAESNYERLEMLGDCFLKLLASTYLYVSNPTYKEGLLHTARQDLISNKSLFEHACSTGIPKYIQSKLFSSKVWAPPFFVSPLPPNHVLDAAELVQTIDSNLKKESSNKKKRKRRKKQNEHSQSLADKAIADVAEAILGASYLSGGPEIALRAARALGIPFSGIVTWSDFGKKVCSSSSKLALGAVSIDAVEAIVGYKIKQPQLLAQALVRRTSQKRVPDANFLLFFAHKTHSSVAEHGSFFLERLEFVGDAVLELMVVQHVYAREQQLTSGGLTLLKGAMVSNAALAALCICSGLYEHFVYKSPPLQTTIRQYAARLECCRVKEYQAAELEGRPPGQFWHELTFPKILSDIVEAVLGAIYVGDHFSTDGIEIIFEHWLKPFYDKYITLKTLSHHPTKILFEIFQHQGCRKFSIFNEKDGTLTRAEGQDCMNAAAVTTN